MSNKLYINSTSSVSMYCNSTSPIYADFIEQMQPRGAVVPRLYGTIKRKKGKICTYCKRSNERSAASCKGCGAPL